MSVWAAVFVCRNGDVVDADGRGYSKVCLLSIVLCLVICLVMLEALWLSSSDILVLKLISVLVFILFSSKNFYFI